MIGRHKFRTEDARKRERVRVTLRIGFLFFCLVCVVGIMAYGSHQDFFRLKNIYVQTDGVITENEIATVLEGELAGNFFGFFPKDSVFLARNETLKNKVSQSFPRIDQVDVQRAGVYTVSTKITERTPEALWCGDVVPSVANKKISDEDRIKEELWGTCYLIDKKGYIYAKAPIYSGNVFPRYYGSLRQAEPIAQQFISEDQFIAWQQFYASLAKKDVFPQALLFVDERDIEVYLSNGLRILVPREEGSEKTQNRLTTLLNSDTIDTSRKVEYIDFRFDTKVFVKYSKE